MRTIIVNGYTGQETDDDQARMYDAKLTEIRAAVASGHLAEGQAVKAFSDWLNHHYASYGCAVYHNAIAAPTGRYNALRREATARVREAGEAYAELDKRTTTAWHAAHHRFVLAATAARDSLAAMIEAAAEAQAAAGAKTKYVTRELYEKMVPAEDRTMNLPDLVDVRAELDGFVETTRNRFALTAATLAGTVPAGFEPAAQPAPAPAYAPQESNPEWLEDWRR